MGRPETQSIWVVLKGFRQKRIMGFRGLPACHYFFRNIFIMSILRSLFAGPWERNEGKSPQL